MNTHEWSLENHDEGQASDPPTDEEPTVPERIRSLLRDHRYGVLCTQGDSGPYGSLVAFAYSDDLADLVFSTPRATRKYRLLSQCRNVALLVDSRSHDPENLMMIDAVTATGEATELSPGEAQRVWSERLVTRHPHLRDFIEAPSSAMFRIAVTRFYHVRRFQDASQWSPPFTER